MRYLHRQAAKRKAPQSIEPGAKAAVVVLDNYFSQQPWRPGIPRIARYARGADYHRVTGQRLERLARYLRRHGAQVARAFVDAGPIPERELAQRAGLGWIGKNTMLIRPGAGSFCFIGSVLTDLALPPDAPFTPDHCGQCTRCLDACPTQALREPRVLDATQCISYLTIEYRGIFPDQLRERLEGWAFGCDICNEVCPWNVRFARETTVAGFRPRPDLQSAGVDFFDHLSQPEFEDRFGDTPLERAGLAGMRRNWGAAVASQTIRSPLASQRSNRA
jgi:epoxyqueuosine reductase